MLSFNRSTFNRIVFVATCSLLVACGGANSGGTVSPGGSAPAAESPQEALSWRAIYFDWEAGELDPQDACGEGRVTLTSDGTLQVRDCGEIRKAQISAEDFADFENELQPILSSIDQPITCSGVAIADYSQNWKLVDQNGRAIQLFRFNIEDTCGRVADVDALNDHLYVLREKYFPRVEEGEYE